MKKTKLYPLYIVCVVVAIIIIFVTGNSDKEEEPSKKETTTPAVVKVGDGITVTFVDVGKADATVISADGYNILIDAGEQKDAEKIIGVLEDKDIESFDMVIVSHNDADHIGGMTAILNNYEVKNFLTYNVEQKYQSTTKTYYGMLDAIEENNVKVTYAKAGDTYTLGNMEVNVISPDHEYKDSNDDSLVVKLSYGESDFLFTGDASEKVEWYLLDNDYDLDCEVLKISHHGSKTATSQEFLEKVSPEIAILPVGKNIYNLPHAEVVKRLNDYPLNLYRSDECGDISLTSDGTKITVTTEKQ